GLFGRLGAATAIACLVLAVVPARFSPRGPAVVEFAPPLVVRAQTAGFVDVVYVDDNQSVAKDDLLLTLSNQELQTELANVEAELKLALRRVRTSVWTVDAARLRDAQSDVAAVKKRLAELNREVASLEVRAPAAGQIVVRNIDQLLGTYLKKGAALALIGSEQSKRLKISVDQEACRELRAGGTVRFYGPRAIRHTATISQIEPRADRRPADPSFSVVAGGPLAVTRSQEGQALLCEPRFNVYADLDAATSESLFVGQRCTIALDASSQSLGGSLWSRLRHWETLLRPVN
ncbi:MAG: biotin/lipoyl-binding protein, partial [Planctomycetota bacterium]